jgi:hypothetical protein
MLQRFGPGGKGAPPAADSGVTWSTTDPTAVPLILASEIRTMSVMPRSRSLEGIRMFPTSGMPG